MNMDRYSTTPRPNTISKGTADIGRGMTVATFTITSCSEHPDYEPGYLWRGKVSTFHDNATVRQWVEHCLARGYIMVDSEPPKV